MAPAEAFLPLHLATLLLDMDATVSAKTSFHLAICSASGYSGVVERIGAVALR